MENINRIKSTFTVNEGYPSGIACLLSVIRYYGRYGLDSLLNSRLNEYKETVTLSDIKKVATNFGFDAKIRLMTIEQLKAVQYPVILFFQNELMENDFVVCYGFDEQRFIIGEPSLGLMQYAPEEVERMWVEGITLTLSCVLPERH